MIKKILIGLIIIILVILCIFFIYNFFIKNTNNENVSMTYEIYDDWEQGTYDYTQRGYYISTDNQPNAPYYYIIAMGEQPTGGYSISIIDVKIDNEKNVEVIVKENKPKLDDIVTQAFTYPVCCLKLDSFPNSIVIKNTEGEIFEELQSNLNIEKFNKESIIGVWYPNDIIVQGEEGGRTLSSYFGMNISEKNHFEFYEDNTYIKLLGDLDEKGTYEIIDNKVYMTSDSGNITICEFSIDEKDVKILTEQDSNLMIYYLKKEEEWKKISLKDCAFYDDENLKIDLDGDEQDENINIKSTGKFIVINDKEYVVNKKVTNRDYTTNQYHICDLNNDNIMEIIHRTFSYITSPITSYYTIYNYYNNKLYEVGKMSFVGNIPNDIYVRDNTIKFEYWPYESPPDYSEEIKIDLQLNYLD